jgi:hypothetical protein
VPAKSPVFDPAEPVRGTKPNRKTKSVVPAKRARKTKRVVPTNAVPTKTAPKRKRSEFCRYLKAKTKPVVPAKSVSKTKAKPVAPTKPVPKPKEKHVAPAKPTVTFIRQKAQKPKAFATAGKGREHERVPPNRRLLRGQACVA